MSDTNKIILAMIKANASLNEITEITGLTSKQIFHRLNTLKLQGYEFARKYYNTGDIVYDLYQGLKWDNEVSLITSSKDNELKVVFVSDLHLVNKNDRVDLLKQVYDFCARKNIHIIINGGDVLDGFVGIKSDKKFKKSQQQIDYLLKNYPYDKNILNFVCFGNHDYSVLKQTGQNIETILSTKRHDIVSLGYGLGKLNIKNEEILVKHFNTPFIKHYNENPERFVLMGHTHRSQNVISDNQAHIYIPMLSSMWEEHDAFPFPSFISASIYFDSGYISNIMLEHYTFIDKLYKFHETNINLSKVLNENNIVKYEEDRKKFDISKIKKLKK